MGGWKLEVFKMFTYMTFPVGIFYYFNQPQYFEKWVVEMKREMYPHENESHRKALQDLAKQFRDKREEEMLKQLEDATNK